jgi:hypothetical protein
MFMVVKISHNLFSANTSTEISINILLFKIMNFHMNNALDSVLLAVNIAESFWPV